MINDIEKERNSLLEGLEKLGWPVQLKDLPEYCGKLSNEVGRLKQENETLRNKINNITNQRIVLKETLPKETIKFYKKVNVRGDFNASYVFQDHFKMGRWFDTGFKQLEKRYGELQYTISDLDGLKIGDRCKVCGEGDNEFEIVDLIKYEEDRYGFVLDVGWTEEVAKCYK
jgi:hypothetical protein